MVGLKYVAVGGQDPYHAALVPVPYVDSRRGTHSHADFHELVYVTAGSGWHYLPDHRRPLRARTLVLVRPHDRHSFASRPGDQLQFVNIAFPTDRWRAFVDFAEVGAAAAWDRAPEPLRTTGSDDVHAAVVRALAAYQAEPDMVELIRLWTAVVPPLLRASAPPDVRPEWLVRACAAMEQEENLRAGLPRMVELAAVSTGYLARSMRTHYGCTPVQFVARLRLARAAAALAMDTAPIGSIAARFGYSSQSYFDRCFADRYGVAPRQYRDRSRRAVVPR